MLDLVVGRENSYNLASGTPVSQGPKAWKWNFPKFPTKRSLDTS